MTRSFSQGEKGKPVMRTGRLLLTDFPLRQQRRISNLFAAADRSPRACSAGVAVRIGWCGDARPNPDAAAQPGLSSLRLAPRGSVLGRCRTFFCSLTNRVQPGSDPVREGAQGDPGGLLHGNNHEGSHDREVVKVCRGFGNVCRA